MVTHLPAHHNPAGKKQECRNKLHLLYCGKILQYGKQKRPFRQQRLERAQDAKGSEAHLGQGGVAVDGTVLLYAQAAEPVGKVQVLLQLFAGQLFQLVHRHAVPAQLPQEGADEAVARTGGVHGPDLLAGGKGMGGAGVGVGPLAAAGVQHQLHIPGKQLGQGGFDVGGAGEETVLARVGEGIVSSIGSAQSHKIVLENPDSISRVVLEKGLDAGTAFEILSIDIADIDVGKNIGAQLQMDQAEADKNIAQAKAEERRAMAVALEQENKAKAQDARAKVILAEAEIWA